MPAGRPKKEIPEKDFEGLCMLQCTKEEMAAFFQCGESTIERWCARTYGTNFEETYKKYAAGGKIGLRRNLFQLSRKNVGAAIFLAKNVLGMTDQPVGVESLETAKRVKAISNLIAKAATKYGSGAASSPVEPEQAGAEHEGGSIPADAAPPTAAKQGRKSAKPSAKGKAPAKAVKSK